MSRLVCSLLIVLSSSLAQIQFRQISVAYNQENALTRLGFNQCNGHPCFLGIVPGLTTWQDATSILFGKGFRLDQDNQEFDNVDNIGNGIVIYRDRSTSNSSVVDTVELADRSQLYDVSLADVLDLYGLPCGVTSDFQNSFWFSYPDLLVHSLSEIRSYSNVAIDELFILSPLARSVAGITTCNKQEYSPEYQRWFIF
jgi:hypothetical protein